MSTPSTPEVTVIVPAYNEVRQIAATIEEIETYLSRRGQSHETIVAADGEDGTRERVAELAVTNSALAVLGHKERRGKGRGIREAMRLARGRIVGFVDADQKTPIEEFDKVAPLLDAGYDVVIGSRGLPDSRIERPQPLYRQIGSRVFGVLMRAVVGLSSIPDTQCGFKFFRAEIGHDLFGRQQIDGYMFDVEILCLAQRSGYRVAQVPVRSRDDGDSRLQLVAGNMRNILDLFQIRFGGVSPGRPTDKASQPSRSRSTGTMS